MNPVPSDASASVTVLVVDDHFVVRSGIVSSLELDDDIRVVAQADRGDAAAVAYQEHRPRVVLMDLQLPGGGGVAATVALRAVDAKARILFFSAFARDDEIQGALDAGALGYLQKSASRDELLTAIRAVAKGDRYLPRELARRLHSLKSGPAITPREREILSLIAAGRANKEIGDALVISEDTVKRHVSHILLKLEVNDRAQATAEAIRRGIIQVRE